MTRVESLEAEIQKLSQEEFAQLREWVLEEDWNQWDAQIEKDASTGKLDDLFARALSRAPTTGFLRAIHAILP